MESTSQWTQNLTRSAAVARRRAELSGQLRAAMDEQGRALTAAQTAQARLEAQEQVRFVLERVQHRAHERAVGAYESLLGALLSDVLPGERSVSMDLHTERGAPALDVFIRKGEGEPLEDALNGTGGSVTNLLSTGLRLVALLRSGRRRFLVLDEADCWIKPSLIPRYANVVSQMARELGVQILMISHHEESLFSADIPNRLQLSRLGTGVLTAEWSPTSQIPVWTEEQDGIRSITLKSVQAHQITHLMLAPGVTLLQGDNDIGKSAVVNALRAVFDGDANDTLIRHHTNEAKVTIDFGPAHLLTWQRFRKGKIKTSYRLATAEGVIIHATDGVKVPEWLTEHTQVGRVDGLDIQIGQQQEPVFLLNQPAPMRAKALAVGQESGHIQSMMQIDRQDVTEARSTLKANERTLELVRRRLRAFALLEGRPETDESTQAAGLGSLDVTGMQSEHQKRLHLMEQAQTLFERWERTHGRVVALEHLSAQDEILKRNPPAPRGANWRAIGRKWIHAARRTQVLNRLGASPKDLSVPAPRASRWKPLVQKWRRANAQDYVLSGLTLGTPVGLVPAPRGAEARRLSNTWRRRTARSVVLGILDRSEAPAWPTVQVRTVAPGVLLKRWAKAQTEQQAAEKDVVGLGQDIASLELALEAIPTCPTCGQIWPHNHPAKVGEVS